MCECKKCGNYIPSDVSICPHCETISKNPLKLIFGLCLLVAVGISTYAFCVQQGIGISQKIWVVILFALPLGLWGVLTINQYIHNVVMAKRVQKHKAHTDHYFINACYCKVCGKLNEHEWDQCICKRCGAESPSAVHSWIEETRRNCTKTSRGAGQYNDPCYGASCSDCENKVLVCAKCGKERLP